MRYNQPFFHSRKFVTLTGMLNGMNGVVLTHFEDLICICTSKKFCCNIYCQILFCTFSGFFLITDSKWNNRNSVCRGSAIMKCGNQMVENSSLLQSSRWSFLEFWVFCFGNVQFQPWDISGHKYWSISDFFSYGYFEPFKHQK